MKKFNFIKSKYLSLGVSEDNIDFAIGSVMDGTKREHILEAMTADYRGMSERQSIQLLEELFEANGGEFKNENRGGYLYGILFSLVGVAGAAFLVSMLVSGEWTLKFIVLAIAGALFGLAKGPSLIIKSFRGTYRDNDDPFRQ